MERTNGFLECNTTKPTVPFQQHPQHPSVLKAMEWIHQLFDLWKILLLLFRNKQHPRSAQTNQPTLGPKTFFGICPVSSTSSYVVVLYHVT
jgi:hypothetical protein